MVSIYIFSVSRNLPHKFEHSAKRHEMGISRTWSPKTIQKTIYSDVMLEVLLIHIIIILYNLNHCKKSYLFVLRHQKRTMHENWIGESNSCGLKKRVTKKVSFHFMKRRLKRSRPHTGNRYGCNSTKKVVQGCRFFYQPSFHHKVWCFRFSANIPPMLEYSLHFFHCSSIKNSCSETR